MYPFVLHIVVILVKAAAVLAALGFAAVSFAKEAKPHRDAPVVQLSFLTLKPEQRDAYLQWISTDGASCMEELKQAGVVVDWRVHGAQTRAPDDPDVIVTVKYRDQAALAALDSSQSPKLAALNSRLHGADDMVVARRAVTELVDG